MKKITVIQASLFVVTMTVGSTFALQKAESKALAISVKKSGSAQLHAFEEQTRIMLRNIERAAYSRLNQSTNREDLAKKIIAEAIKEDAYKKEWRKKLNQIDDKDFVANVTALEERARKEHLGEAVVLEDKAEDAVRAYAKEVREGVEKLVQMHKAALEKEQEEESATPPRKSSESINSASGREIDADRFFKTDDSDGE